MTFVEALVYGAVQGLTEFLPVSSDGHLSLASHVLAQKGMPLALVTWLHVGTFLATLFWFRREVWMMLKTMLSKKEASQTQAPQAEESVPIRSDIWGLFFATLVTAVLAFGVKDWIEPLNDNVWVIFACMLCTAAALMLTKEKSSQGARARFRWQTAFLLGVLQAAAVLPGLSRSGMTLFCLHLIGFDSKKSFEYSFLLSLPVVAGAILLKMKESIALSIPLEVLATGVLVSFVAGLGALFWLKHWVVSGKLNRFALYLFVLVLVGAMLQFL